MNFNFDVLKGILSTALISDVLDELGLEGMLSHHFQPNFFEAKLFGRAKTIKVEKIKDGEDPEGIYKGLDIFDTIEKGDVIIVSNEVKDLAYWGELNSNLAIRAGAVGSIVDSVTRDNFYTRKLGYPVFAKGRYAKDIKSRGIIKELNVPVEVDGILIRPGDLIFADIDGVIVIPQEYAEKVINKALEVAENEKDIIANVSKGVPAKELVKKHGFF
jgi:regulator of RNase E activity RraA